MGVFFFFFHFNSHIFTYTYKHTHIYLFICIVRDKMVLNLMGLEDFLGLIYVTAWSISIYSPIWENVKCKSTKGMSMDFSVLNTMGYFYLLISMILQMFYWIPVENTNSNSQLPFKANMVDNDVKVSNRLELNNLESPKITSFDLFYCLHGEVMNLVILSQLFWGKKLWRFHDDKKRRMKPLYFKIFLLSIFIFAIYTFQFLQSSYFIEGWNNRATLRYCNKLFVLKISMSLIKYIPQVKHNMERKSVKGFSITGVILDIIGGVAALLQLLLQLSRENGGNFTLMLIFLNFGKIGLSLVAITFGFIFIIQAIIYGNA